MILLDNKDNIKKFKLLLNLLLDITIIILATLVVDNN
jgi:hypothetical protein